MLSVSAPTLTAIGGLGAFLASVVLACATTYQAVQSRRQVTAIRDTASAQLRPVVHVQPTSPWIVGPEERLGLGRREMALVYALSNDGGGVALRVQHGVNIGGVVEAFGYGRRIDALKAGEHVPTIDLAAARGPTDLLMVSVHEEEVPGRYKALDLTYWVKYESVLGEPLQTETRLAPRQLRDLMRRFDQSETT